MGYVESIGMESRRRSVLSGPGSSLDIRGKPLKSSPFCPHTSNKGAQSLIKSHMMSHYKRIYSAKDNDRMRQERLKKGGRPQSAQSLSHRNSRASCSSAQSRFSVQSEGRPYLCSRSSMVSSPRFSHSFYAQELPSPPYKAAPQNHPCRPYSASEIKHRSQEPTTHQHPLVCSQYTSGDQSFFRSFQNPAKKTYSGDLLQKHSQRFTQDKPFTPKTLKSEKSSYLSNYRYYRAPRNNAAAQECDDPTRLKHRNHTKTREQTKELCEPHQGKEHHPSEDEYTYSIASRQQANKGRDDSFDYSSRVPLEAERKGSPVMKNTSAEDEELMYLEFISDVTEDILSRGFISNRVLDRVIQRHIDMNLHRLDEAKMRHLLDILRNNLDEPSTLSSYSEELGRKDASSLLDSLLASDQVKTEDNLFFYESLRKDSDCPECPEPILSSTLQLSPKRSSPFANERTEGDENTSGDVTNNADKKDDEDQHQKSADRSSEPEVEGHFKELEDLARQFSESLKVNENNVDTNTVASVSDEDF
ncbi:spermatogenesis-associated protein 7 homolog isoform X2 [Dunckerocampus dactyliophorus]|uniref:spermatogenesis-associated protein 7 homolog isoform X2 n=1 Tax=Dunckerocampus dactyliophorus TaxID=161453 RepID=UPI002405EA19|nr:spermatogenesis-associated protein 7 homolog isoform X2 [Dunckerocampus dactyliophorus]